MVKSFAVLRETKTDLQGREIENRVVLIPSQIKTLKDHCPTLNINVENDAGRKIDFSDDDYLKAGASICSHQTALIADIIVGVKETNLADFPSLNNNLWISYQHFAQSQERTLAALKTGAIFLTLETMEEIKDGLPSFPCLTPMSEAAAKVVARHADEYALLKKKIITSGLPETGLHGAKTVIIGGGSVGKTAAEEFSERGCEVIILEKRPSRIKSLTEYFYTNRIRFPKVAVQEITLSNIRQAVSQALFLVSAMYTSGKRPEQVIPIDLLKSMQPGGCVYPIDIDQGGGIEGVVETSLLEPFDLPTIKGTEIACFAPPNLPSLGARTTSEALGTVLLPYFIEIVNKGWEKAAKENPIIGSGLNIAKGKIIHPGLSSVFPTL